MTVYENIHIRDMTRRVGHRYVCDMSHSEGGVKVCLETFMCDMTRRVGNRYVRDMNHSDVSEDAW